MQSYITPLFFTCKTKIGKNQLSGLEFCNFSTKNGVFNCFSGSSLIY